MNCKYCGKKKATPRSLLTHENACPEMRYFADFALKHSVEDSGTVILGGVQTTDLRILLVVRKSAAPAEKEQ